MSFVLDTLNDSLNKVKTAHPEAAERNWEVVRVKGSGYQIQAQGEALSEFHCANDMAVFLEGMLLFIKMGA